MLDQAAVSATVRLTDLLFRLAYSLLLGLWSLKSFYNVSAGSWIGSHDFAVFWNRRIFIRLR